MSQDELLDHIDTRLARLDRPFALMKWLVVGGFAMGAWATAQQMSITHLFEWKAEQRITDQRQDTDIRELDRNTRAPRKDTALILPKQ